MKMDRDFEWDAAKATANEVKHGVPFPFAARVFLDPAVLDIDAARPEDGEFRRKAVGMIGSRLFTVVFTTRGAATRLISTLWANASEERRYGSL